jgi:hypothetical protein
VKGTECAKANWLCADLIGVLGRGVKWARASARRWLSGDGARCAKGTGASAREPSHAPAWGLSAGSLREPRRRISCGGADRCKGELDSRGWGAEQGRGAGDAPWGGRGAPARSAPVRHPARGVPRVPVRCANLHAWSTIWGLCADRGRRGTEGEGVRRAGRTGGSGTPGLREKQSAGGKWARGSVGAFWRGAEGLIGRRSWAFALFTPRRLFVGSAMPWTAAGDVQRIGRGVQAGGRSSPGEWPEPRVPAWPLGDTVAAGRWGCWGWSFLGVVGWREGSKRAIG